MNIRKLSRELINIVDDKKEEILRNVSSLSVSQIGSLHPLYFIRLYITRHSDI